MSATMYLPGRYMGYKAVNFLLSGKWILLLYLGSKCTHYITANNYKHILIIANKLIHIIFAYFVAAASDKCIAY